MKKIAVYGKGGIGKSTITSNVAAALAVMGYKVMQVGCDPKADSTKNLTKGTMITTILDLIKEKGNDVQLEDIVTQGFAGVLCAEAGGPAPGIGCAGRGIIAAFEKLEELEAFETYCPDIVIYDVLGDVVCGGFAMPIRNGYAEDIFIVTSGEMMALYAADNIHRAVGQYASKGYAKVKGVILNARNVENERALVERACQEMGTEILIEMPRSSEIQIAENMGCTVSEALPEGVMAKQFAELARLIMESSGKTEASTKLHNISSMRI